MPKPNAVSLVAAVSRRRGAMSSPSAPIAGLAFALWATHACAQIPAPAPQVAASELRLELLATALRGDVYLLQNLQSAVGRAGDATQDPPPRSDGEVGSKAARPFATIRDACFDAEGRLLALLVEPPAGDRRAEPVVRVLPAAQIEWDAGRRLWLGREANLKLAELAPAADLSKTAPAPATGRPAARPWLASQLVLAVFDPRAFAPQGAPAESPAATTAAGTTAVCGSFWLAPRLQRLVVVVVPVPSRGREGQPATQCFVLPWALLQPTVTADGLVVRIGSTATSLATGPTCDRLATEPDHALRQRCYVHFQLAAPSWDQPIAAGAPHGR